MYSIVLGTYASAKGGSSLGSRACGRPGKFCGLQFEARRVAFRQAQPRLVEAAQWQLDSNGILGTSGEDVDSGLEYV